jgi:hypothetical protein
MERELRLSSSKRSDGDEEIDKSDAKLASDSEVADDIPLQALPTLARPELNRVEWETFKVLQAVEEKDSFAIDVLEGEPVITFDPLADILVVEVGDRHGKLDKKATERKVQKR